MDKLYREYLRRLSSQEEWKQLSADYEQLWNLPHCVGAIHICYVHIPESFCQKVSKFLAIAYLELAGLLRTPSELWQQSLGFFGGRLLLTQPRQPRLATKAACCLHNYLKIIFEMKNTLSSCYYCPPRIHTCRQGGQ